MSDHDGRSADFRSRTTDERAQLIAAGRDPGSTRRGERRRQRLDERPSSASLPPLEVLRGLDSSTLTAALGLGPSALLQRGIEAPRTSLPGNHVPVELDALLAEGAASLLRWAAPFASTSVHEVRSLLGEGPVLNDALAALVKRMADFALPTLVAELQLERRARPSVASTPSARLDELCNRLVSPAGRRRLFEAYPVLARRMALVADQWRHALTELISSIDRDRSTLAHAFGARGPLTQVCLDLGDRHRGGRSVAAIGFASGAHVVYKPRPLEVERRLQIFLAEVSGRLDLELSSRTVISRKTYGWDAWVDDDRAIEAADIGRYFRRFGVLLAVLFPLRIRDLHCANVVASRGWPVILDAEAILVPTLRVQHGSSPRADLSATLMATGALPGLGAGPDVSALGAQSGKVIASGGPMLVDEATDEIAVQPVRRVLADPRSLPLRDGAHMAPGAWVEDLLAGFDSGYRVALRHRRLWHRFVDENVNREIRVVARPTRFYGELLLASSEPAVLGDALDLDALLDHLGLWPGAADHPKLLTSERAQLHALDTPVFTARPASLDVIGGDGARLTSLVERRGSEAAHHQIEALSDGDARRQRHLMESVLTVGPAPRLVRCLVSRSNDPVAQAEAIGRYLADVAVPGVEGSTWVAPRVDEEQAVRVEAVGLDLYDGLPGIVLFLAELANATADEQLRQLARRGTREILVRLDDAHLSIGAWGGAAGVAYVLARLAKIWSEPALASTAFTLLQNSAGRLVREEGCCVISGAAGLALVARRLAHGDHTGTMQGVLRAAQERIASMAVSDDSTGDPTWPAVDHDGHTVTGLAHGLAGIAWALAAEGAGPPSTEANGRARMSKLAERAISAERRRFVEAAVGGGAGRPERANSWCHGFPGLAVARSAMASAWGFDAAELSSEIERAVVALLDAREPESDGLCHGTLGIYESLGIVGNALGRGEWIDEATRKLQKRLERAAQMGWRLVSPCTTPGLGLMTGIAGVGHALLRLSDRRIPAVLSLD